MGTKKNVGHLIAYMPPGMETGLAWFPYVIFKGAIDFKFNWGGLLPGRNNVNKPRAPRDVLALNCEGTSKFLSRWKGKLRV